MPDDNLGIPVSLGDGRTVVRYPVYRDELAAVECLAVATASALRHLLTMLIDPEVDRQEIARVATRISAALEMLGR